MQMTTLSPVHYNYSLIPTYFMTFDLSYRPANSRISSRVTAIHVAFYATMALEMIFNCLLYKSHFVRQNTAITQHLCTIRNAFSQARCAEGPPICVYVFSHRGERVWMWRMLNVGVCCVTKCTLSQNCRGSLAGSGGPRWPLLCQSTIVSRQMSSDALVAPTKPPPYSSASSMLIISAFWWMHPDVFAELNAQFRREEMWGWKSSQSLHPVTPKIQKY